MGVLLRSFNKIIWPWFLIVFLALSSLSCGDNRSVSVKEDADLVNLKPDLSKQQPVEFVLCIDNSKSIKPHEQILIREAAMLLGDLSDNGDRISVITFGKDANLVTGIRFDSDSDRRRFKQAVNKRVDFTAGYSDLRLGLREIVRRSKDLFSPTNTKRVVVLFTDGKLEPADHKGREAFKELENLMDGPLKSQPIHTVLLGTTTSQHQIPGLQITGQELMQHIVANDRNELFFHAKQLDQLFDVVVQILKKAKGISSLGEEGQGQFRIDKTVESMTLIVRKRQANNNSESSLPVSKDISLIPPEGSQPDSENTYRSSDYQNFDLFVIHSPRSGLWRVTLSNGKEPSVLSKIVSPIDIAVKMPDGVYINEASSLQAWVYNKEASKIINGDYEVKLRVRSVKNNDALAESFIDLLKAPDGQYYLEIPTGLFSALNSDGTPTTAELLLEVVVRDRNDQWFLRRSDAKRLDIVEPLITWRTIDDTLQRIPLRPIDVSFGAEMTEAKYNAEGFEVPPKIQLTVERWDDSNQTYKSVAQKIKEPVRLSDPVSFLQTLAIRENGRYRYRYGLSGLTSTGRLEIASPWYPLIVSPAWPVIGAAMVVFLILLHVTGTFMARLRGWVEVEVEGPIMQPEGDSINISRGRVFNSSKITEADLGGRQFVIKTSRVLMFFKRIQFQMIKQAGVLDNQEVKTGKSLTIQNRKEHTLRFSRDDGAEVTVRFQLRV